MAREINLVPDIKNEMIKAIKLRNLILFICICVAIGSVALVVIVGGTVGIQKGLAEGNKETISMLSSKLKEYGDLESFLTIKTQTEQLNEISNNKKVLSRTFDFLNTLLPTGADKIAVSSLSINLEDNTWLIEAQADAGEDDIDYRVLDAFSKSMNYMHYDYGNYVDEEGNIIPDYCIIERNQDGSLFRSNDSIYAFWTKYVDGCNPGYIEEEAEDDEEQDDTQNSDDTLINLLGEQILQLGEVAAEDAEIEYYGGVPVVRIWRTPRFAEWYENDYLSLDGQISGIEHFESDCITYTGNENGDTYKVTWDTAYECSLIDTTEADNGIYVSESSNGRNSDDNLVLRFSATIYFDSDAYSFANKHLISIPPSGRHNVTDSYMQIQNMFSKKATDCSQNDTTCKNANKEEK